MKKLTKKEIEAGYTVKMPKELLEKFLATLRSGEVKQGYGALFDGRGYCCLGVLQAVESGGRCELGTAGFSGFAYLPSHAWAERAGVSQLTENEGGINPVLDGMPASEWNDGHGATFSEIADLFEKYTAAY